MRLLRLLPSPQPPPSRQPSRRTPIRTPFGSSLVWVRAISFADTILDVWVGMAYGMAAQRLRTRAHRAFEQTAVVRSAPVMLAVQHVACG